MRRTFVEFAVLSPFIIFAIIVVLFFIHIYRNQPVNNSKKDITPSIHYSTVEHNGHTYIQNHSGSFFVHNTDCTNSKCLKD